MKRYALLCWVSLALAIGACGQTDPKTARDEARAQKERSLAKRLKSVCSSQATYDRLKQVAFDEAIQIRNADPANLDTLSTYSLVRVENPVVKSRDETLDVTVCTGRFILQIPPGAERAFDGKRQIAADIEYAAQAAADGSGLVYQIKGAEPIIYRLATFDLKSQAYRPSARATQIAQADRDALGAKPQKDPESPPRIVPIPTPGPAPVKAPIVPVRTAAQKSGSSAPSFNCRGARSHSERLVCGSDRLASLDRQMSSQFYSELSRGDERTRTALRRTRDSFLRKRERCGDPTCVGQAYLDRMNEISEITRGG